MAKPTVAKGKKAPSKHSRAARRDMPVDIDTDKSLKEARAPQDSVDNRPAVLAAHRSGGVTKKKSGRKAVLSHKARQRAEKSMDRAEAIMERTLTKIQKSKNSAKVIAQRRKPWEDINGDVGGVVPAKKLTKRQLFKMEEDAMVAKFFADDDGNVEMDGADAAEGLAKSVPIAQPLPVEDEEVL
ncbi:Alb1-domain-containing protein [Cladorrhinum samala]|uniref:Alb1-domain-containing protein n=1 Tax=Cladorrhinum samala TaxID=585594 RepID=A0AAV9HIN0_9PEZI|nr:Alb1-domain-containing protein [Cladorrhinum samala]